MLKRNGNAIQCIASCKGINANLCNRIRDKDSGQRSARGKCKIINGGNRIRDGDGGKRRTVGERALTDGGNFLRNAISCRIYTGGISNQGIIRAAD